MPRSNSVPRFQLQLRGGYGETEVLWVESAGDDLYRVLNTPVYAYGISVGTVVRAVSAQHGRLQLADVVAPSRGGTIRIVTREGVRASELYKEHVLPRGSALGLHFGPATMLDPRLVAVYVDNLQASSEMVSRFLDGLERDGSITAWEMADPDSSPPPAEEEQDSRSSVVLVHPGSDDRV